MSKRILVIDDSPTLRKVVTSILERSGYQAASAQDGQQGLEALTNGQRFDLVLLDFVMPRMNGYQFCRAVRSHERLRAVPIVLMSAKGDRIREQFVQQTGAVDAITKPFDAQALVAVIENAFHRIDLGTARSFTGFEGDEPPSSLSLRGATSDELQRAARTAQEVSAKLARVLAPSLAELAEKQAGAGLSSTPEGALSSLLATRLTSEVLRELLNVLQTSDLGAHVILSGDLGTLPIGAILQLLQVERQTGMLEINRPTAPRTETSAVRTWQSVAQSRPLPTGTEILISWRNGLVDLVQSRGAGDEFRLGRYFVEEGLVTPGEIEALLNRRDSEPPPGSGPRSSRRLLGDLLLETQRISEEQLRASLVRQASELIYEVIRWQKGRFEFRRQPPSPQADRARLSLPVASVVMEGFRRVDEWRVVEATLGSFESVLQRDPMAIEALGASRLSRAEGLVLDIIDGERTIREILAESHMSSFDACRILTQLIEARVVRRRAAS
jgi:CheY-like chemotaxis protein